MPEDTTSSSKIKKLRIVLLPAFHQVFLFNLVKAFPEHEFHLIAKQNVYKWIDDFCPRPPNLYIDMEREPEKNYDLYICNDLTVRKEFPSLPRIYRFNIVGAYAQDGYPEIYGATRNYKYGLEQKANARLVREGRDPNIFKDWNGQDKRVLYICCDMDKRGEIGEGGGVSGKIIWDEIRKRVPSRTISAIHGGRWGYASSPKVLPFNEYIKALRDSRVYVECLSGFGRGMSGSLIEAMMTGCPCVIYETDNDTTLIGKKAGQYVTNDVKTMIQYIKILQENYDLAREMGKQARKYTLDNLSLENMRSGYQKAIDDAFEFKRTGKVQLKKDLIKTEKVVEKEKTPETHTGYFCPVCGVEGKLEPLSKTYYVCPKCGKII